MPQATKSPIKSSSSRATTAALPRSKSSGKKSTKRQENGRAKAIVGSQAYQETVEHGQSAIMMIDRDFKITYVNQRTRKMLNEYSAIFKRLWPSLDVDQIIGTCIDMFHKNPQHQRQLLSDPSRLPYKTDIRIADLAFSLQVTAQYNAAGEYVGNTLEWSDVTALRRLEGVSAALEQSQAVIEFTLDGTVITANKNFLNTLGYTLEEIQGKPHSLFVDPQYAASADYRQFWQDLNAGKYQTGEFCRVGKGGKQVWIQASYNPIVDQSGKPFRVIKYASDITAAKTRNADFEGQLRAINLSQAVIEFTMDGVIVQANDNFLNTVGYSSTEVVGKHHSMFVDSEYARSADYRLFWDDLKQGKFRTDQFLRYGKGGRAIWIQASYNPILDINGKPIKVVKYATDITAQKDLERAIAQKQKEDAEFAEAQQQKVQVVLSIVNAMADGNFSVDVPDLGADAVGQVSQSLRQAMNSMRQALTEVRNVSATVATSAEQLSSASREISSGAQEQASSLEETASSLEEITSTVKQNTDNAQQARQLATGSRDVAEKGGQVVGNAVEAMGAINQASKKIADIITTIDEIAFQTNLLALNAAVEAARAGEQGRGFAVVAAEVRNLAQRSASAAKEIKTLIQDSLRKVENGTELVNKSGETLGEIVSSVKRVTDIVAEIAAASKEQLTGIEQVNKAVAQMDRVTQSNASQTEEVAGTAGSLLQHAERLRDLVSHFQLGDHARGGAGQQPQKSATPSVGNRETSRITPSSPSNTRDFGSPAGTFEF